MNINFQSSKLLSKVGESNAKECKNFEKLLFKCFRFFLHFKQSEARIINDLLITVVIYEIKAIQNKKTKQVKL